jgi:hypothetical protein
VTYRLSLVLPLFGCLMLVGAANLSAMPSPMEVGHEPLAAVDATAGRTKLTQAQSPQAPAAPDPAAATAQAPADEPIGNVVTLTGTVTVIRNKDSLPLKLKDDIFFNDTVQTSTNSTLGITFNDATTFNLSANSKMTIDNYVYEEGGSQNAGAFDIAKGTVAFVAAAVAKTGDMKITTPTASLGIRGTTGLVEVPEGATAANANNVAIKLYPDADGRVGRIEVNDRAGARLGALTQGASGFTIRPGMGGGARFAAVPLAISPREAQRDQGFVRQVHAAQTVGRQIVTEQRAFRRANPGLNNNRGNQPGQPRPNGAPGQNRPGQPQPGAPNRQGPQQPGNPQQPGRPGQPARPGQTTPPQTPQGQPGAPNRQGTQQQPGGPQQLGQPPRPGLTPQQGAGQPGTPPRPGSPPQPGLPQRLGVPQQAAPGVLRPGLQNRPALQRPRPGAPPKGKQEKKRR